MWLPSYFKSWGTSSTPQATRRLQILRAVGAFGLLTLVSFGIATLFFGKKEKNSFGEEKKLEPLSLETSSSKLDFHELYFHKIEDDNAKLLKDIKDLKENLASTLQEKSLHEDKSLGDLNERLNSLEAQWIPHSTRPDNSSLERGGEDEKTDPTIYKHTLNLVDAPQVKTLKTVETTIPAGAFAKTILLSGLDASAAMSASSDPRPMLLRIIDYGTLPRQFQSDLKDCHCTASAFGDLSSERIYARLEKLTCINRRNGEIIETQVAGYIAGSDGKVGIRGVVASKDGQFLGRSLMGGIFSGLSNVANPQNRRVIANPFTPGGTGIPPISMGENFTSGMASGASSALDRLSQYYIDRAEQLQPVIQVDAGQIVDIVFTEGVLMGGDRSLPKSKNFQFKNSPFTEYQSPDHSLTPLQQQSNPQP